MKTNNIGADSEIKTCKRSWKRHIKKNMLRVACWNITSLSNKDQELLIEINRHKVDICALSETKKKGKGNDIYGNYILIYSGKDKGERASSGVGLLVHSNYRSKVTDTFYINDRILHVIIAFNSRTRTHFLSVYAPDINKSQEEKNKFYSALQRTLDTISPRDEVIILGDLNARVGNQIVPGVKNQFNEAVMNENGRLLVHFCLQNNLRINNTYFDHKEQHKYTFINTRWQKSTIDYIISNYNIHPQRIHDVRVLSSANIGTDHNLVLMKIATCSEFNSRNKTTTQATNTIEKYNIESFRHPSTTHLYQSRLSLKINENIIMPADSVNKAWEKMELNILNAAAESLGKRPVKANRKNMPYKPWFCDEVKTLAEEKRASYLQYRSRKISYVDYKATRNRVNADIVSIKRQYWERFSSEMEHDLYGAQKKVWNMLRNLKNPINEHVSFTNISIKDWENYFRQLYENEQDDDERIEETEPERGEPCSSDDPQPLISIDDVVFNATKLKNRKSPGQDCITNEMLKYGGDELYVELSKFFNKILEQQKIPTAWKHSITIPVFKKGDRKIPDNYRGITLLSAILKLFTKILANILAESGISEEQQGFRRNRSTIDAIFILRQIIEKSIEYNKPAYLCFVDLTKAFDRVVLKDVIDILQKRNIDNRIISAIKNLNTDNTTSIKVDNNMSAILPVTSGIRQGDSLSPILFNLIMDEIIEKVKCTARGYKLKTEIKIICYADDAVLLSDNEDDLQRLLYSFEKAADTFNMKISASKTKSLTISRQPLRCKLAVYGTPIEQVMEFNYLGAKITSSKDLSSEVIAQTNKAARVAGCLRDTIWRNKHLSTKGKVRIYKTCVRPILTYAIETRADMKSTEHAVSRTEMHTLRTIAGFTRWDLMRNEDIRQICDVQDVIRWSRKRRREWNQHVQRMSNQRLAKIAMVEKPTTSRCPGRPPKRWRECWTSSSTET